MTFSVNHPALFLLLVIPIAPVVLMLVLFIFVPALSAGTVGVMVPVGVLFTLAVSRVLYKKGVL